MKGLKTSTRFSLFVLSLMLGLLLAQTASCQSNGFSIDPAPGWGSTFVARGLSDPSNIAISPQSNRIFFAQACRWDYIKNAPNSESAQRRGWESVGNSEGIYELHNGVVTYLCPGAGDTWGGMHFTQVTCGYNGELYIHQSTWIDEQLCCYRMDSVQTVFREESPYGKGSGSVSGTFGGFAVSPKDEQLYIFNTGAPGIDILSKSNKIVPWLRGADLDPDGPMMYDGMCVDRSGNFYLFHADGFGDARKLWIDIVKHDKSVEKLNVQDASEVVGKSASALGGSVIRYNQCNGNLISIGSIKDKPDKDSRPSWHWAIFTISLVTGKVARIASINGYDGNIFDMEVDKYGNIYIPLSFEGVIVKMQPKKK